MTAISQEVYAQANRGKRTRRNVPTFCEKDQLWRCSCGEKLVNSKYVKDSNPPLYVYPKCSCGLVWYHDLIGAPRDNKPYLREDNDTSQRKRHRCMIGKCFNVRIVERKDEYGRSKKLVIVSRTGKCNEAIYCAFQLDDNGKMEAPFAYCLSQGESRKEFYVDIRKEIHIKSYYSHDISEFYDQFNSKESKADNHEQDSILTVTSSY